VESLKDVVVLKLRGYLYKRVSLINIIDEASEVELVDLPPDELDIKRLQQGKVYVQEQVGLANRKILSKRKSDSSAPSCQCVLLPNGSMIRLRT